MANQGLKKLSRQENAEIKRERILIAAEKVIGEFGYQDASIARIAIEAGVAQGSIYRYFDTRQRLLDEVLPFAGDEVVEYIGKAIQGAKTFREVEEKSVLAFFEYSRDNPGYYRVLSEAEFAAPVGHKKHFQNLVSHYMLSMKRSIRDGSLRRMTNIEMKVAAYSMLAARSYLYLSYVKYGDLDIPPQEILDGYLACYSLTKK